MSLESDLATALGALVAGEAFPNTFRQHQAWPAIRYQLVSAAYQADICGDGGDETADQRVQVDGVAKTYDGMRALRAAILGTMSAFDPPAIASGAFEEFDAEAKCHRVSLDFVLQPSSAEAVP